jgi:hypothetical protein
VAGRSVPTKCGMVVRARMFALEGVFGVVCGASIRLSKTLAASHYF